MKVKKIEMNLKKNIKYKKKIKLLITTSTFFISHKFYDIKNTVFSLKTHFLHPA